MNTKMAINSQLSPTESKQKQTKQIMRTGTKSYIWRSFGGVPAGKGNGENETKVSGIKKYKLVGTK